MSPLRQTMSLTRQNCMLVRLREAEIHVNKVKLKAITARKEEMIEMRVIAGLLILKKI